MKHVSPALNGNLVIRCFKHGNAIEIILCSRIAFESMGLPHTCYIVELATKQYETIGASLSEPYTSELIGDFVC